MDIQLLLVILIFAASVFYIFRRIVRQFQGKKKAGCEKCGIVAANAEEKAAAEKAMQDSIAQAEQASSAMQEQAAMQDSANANANMMSADSTVK